MCKLINPITYKVWSGPVAAVNRSGNARSSVVLLVARSSVVLLVESGLMSVGKF